MSNVQTQRGLELEIMELEDKLAYKKDILKTLRTIDTNGRYYLGCDGIIHELVPTVNNLTWQKAINQNNTFKTVKDAEKERDRLELLYEVNQFRDECNNGWFPDWSNFNQIKCFIGFQRGVFEACVNWSLDNFSEFGYFKNKKDCEKAIEKFGDRIKKLYID